MVSEQEKGLLAEEQKRRKCSCGSPSGCFSCCGDGHRKVSGDVELAQRLERGGRDDEDDAAAAQSSGWCMCCSCCRRQQPREFTVEEKNTYMRKVYALLFAQTTLATACAGAVFLCPDLKDLYASSKGQLVTALSGAFMIGSQVWARLRRGDNKGASLTQLFGFTVAQCTGFAGFCALAQSDRIVRGVLLYSTFMTTAFLHNAFYGLQTRYSYTAKPALVLIGITIAGCAAGTAAPMARNLLGHNLIDVAVTGALAYLMGLYTLQGGESMLRQGQVDPIGGDVIEGANLLYSQFVEMIGNFFATGGTSTAFDLLHKGYRVWKAIGPGGDDDE